MVNNASLIAKASVKVEYLSTKEILEGTIEFWQRQYGIYYIYFIRNSGGEGAIAGKSNFVSNKLFTEENKLEKALNHAVYYIDNFLASRKRLFKVIQTTLVPATIITQ